jgi:hypothetical protein
VTQWSAHFLGEHLRGQGLALSDTSVARILKHADLQPHRQQMWLTSQDDEFRAKRDDVLRVYYEAPRNEHIVCVDEKTGIQALERRYADIPMVAGQPLRREFEYRRHGTLCWMGAFDVRRGKPFGFTSVRPARARVLDEARGVTQTHVRERDSLSSTTAAVPREAAGRSRVRWAA